MQLIVQNRLDPSRATEIFSTPKRQILRYPNKSGLQYFDSSALVFSLSSSQTLLGSRQKCAWVTLFVFLAFLFLHRSITNNKLSSLPENLFPNQPMLHTL